MNNLTLTLPTFLRLHILQNRLTIHSVDVLSRCPQGRKGHDARETVGCAKCGPVVGIPPHRSFEKYFDQTETEENLGTSQKKRTRISIVGEWMTVRQARYSPIRHRRVLASEIRAADNGRTFLKSPCISVYAHSCSLTEHPIPEMGHRNTRSFHLPLPDVACRLSSVYSGAIATC